LGLKFLGLKFLVLKFLVLKFLGLKFLGLRTQDGGRRIGRPVSHHILLTELSHVNRPGAEISPRRTQNGILGVSLSTVYALELTVPHKTVAEPY
jgi:hypothetical protein